MWEVIRKKYDGYGDGVVENQEINFATNNQHIAKFSCKPNPKEQDPNSCTPGYGALLYTKINKLTQSDNEILVIKSVRSLHDLYKADTKNITASILYTEDKLIPNLVDLLKKDFAREDVLRTLCKSYKAKIARDQIIPHVEEIQQFILNNYKTENPTNIYLTLKLFKGVCFEKEPCKIVTDTGVLPVLTMKCLNHFQQKDMNPKVMKNGFKLLNNLLQVPKTHVVLVEEDQIFLLVEDIFEHHPTDEKILISLMEHISKLSFYTDGLTKCGRFIYYIMPHLRSKNQILLLESINALSHITISVEAKCQIMDRESQIKKQFIANLVHVFDGYQKEYQNDYIFINNLKIICNLAEKDRPSLLFLLPKIMDLVVLSTTNESVKEELENTYRIISYKP